MRFPSSNITVNVRDQIIPLVILAFISPQNKPDGNNYLSLIQYHLLLKCNLTITRNRYPNYLPNYLAALSVYQAQFIDDSNINCNEKTRALTLDDRIGTRKVCYIIVVIL